MKVAPYTTSHKTDIASLEQRAAVDHYNSQFAETIKAVGRYRTLSTDKALAEQKGEQRRYEAFSRYSILLFTVGWVIGLVGKVVEPSGKEGENEVDDL